MIELTDALFAADVALAVIGTIFDRPTSINLFASLDIGVANRINRTTALIPSGLVIADGTRTTGHVQTLVEVNTFTAGVQFVAVRTNAEAACASRVNALFIQWTGVGGGAVL